MSGQRLVHWGEIFKKQSIYSKHERKVLIELKVMAAAFMLALEEKAPEETFEIGAILTFCSESPIGLALAVAAAEARKRGPRSWAAFVQSMANPREAITAAAAWAILIKKNEKEPIVSWLERKREGGVDESEEDFYDNLVRSSIPQGIENIEEFALVASRAMEANRKRQSRGARDKTSRNYFRLAVSRDWLTESLWCRSTASIVALYDGSEAFRVGPVEAAKRFDQAISAEGLACSRNSSRDAEIDSAVDRYMGRLRRLPPA